MLESSVRQPAQDHDVGLRQRAVRCAPWHRAQIGGPSIHTPPYAPWQDEECEPLGQAIAEVEGGSPRRGRSPTRSSPFGDSPRLHRRDHGRPDAGSPERRLRQRSLELQEADTRDAKGRVRCCRDDV